MLNQEILGELRSSLEEERKKIIGELKEIASPDPRIKGNWNATFPKFEETESGSSGSTEEEQDEVEEYEVRLAAEHSIESRLLEVTKAITRMEQGSYGICTFCKKEIPLPRLRANPAAEFDMEHAT